MYHAPYMGVKAFGELRMYQALCIDTKINIIVFILMEFCELGINITSYIKYGIRPREYRSAL